MEALKLYQNGAPMFRSLFNDFWGDDWLNTVTKNENSPAINIKETENEYFIDVAAPGLSKEDFKISIDNDVLTISAEKETKSEEKNEEGRFTRKEFSYQNFVRSLMLPKGQINKEHVSANYENGVLKITLPKRDEAKPQPVKYISIQ